MADVDYKDIKNAAEKLKKTSDNAHDLGIEETRHDPRLNEREKKASVNLADGFQNAIKDYAEYVKNIKEGDKVPTLEDWSHSSQEVENRFKANGPEFLEGLKNFQAATDGGTALLNNKNNTVKNAPKTAAPASATDVRTTSEAATTPGDDDGKEKDGGITGFLKKNGAAVGAGALGFLFASMLGDGIGGVIMGLIAAVGTFMLVQSMTDKHEGHENGGPHAQGSADKDKAKGQGLELGKEYLIGLKIDKEKGTTEQVDLSKEKNPTVILHMTGKDTTHAAVTAFEANGKTIKVEPIVLETDLKGNVLENEANKTVFKKLDEVHNAKAAEEVAAFEKAKAAAHAEKSVGEKNAVNGGHEAHAPAAPIVAKVTTQSTTPTQTASR